MLRAGLVDLDRELGFLSRSGVLFDNALRGGLVDHFHGLAERRIDNGLVVFGNRSIEFFDCGFQFAFDRLLRSALLADVTTLFLADLIFGKPYTSFYINPVLFIIPSYTFKCQVFFVK